MDPVNFNISVTVVIEISCHENALVSSGPTTTAHGGIFNTL